MWLRVKCGNIERFVPVGWATLTVHDVSGYQLGGSFSQRVSSNVVMPDGTSKELPWEAGFVDKDGVGTSQPNWITVDKTSFPGRLRRLFHCLRSHASDKDGRPL